MSTNHVRKIGVLLIAVATMTVFLVASSTAFAQRDAGAKARGEFGRGFWNQPRRSSGTYYSRQPVAQSRQAFSYEPANFQAGEVVSVKVNETKMMKGTDTIAMLKEGQEFEVRNVNGPWLGATVDVDGQTLSGWIWNGHVAKVGGQVASGEGSTTQERRSFSFEPAEQPVRQPAVQSRSSNKWRNPAYRRQHPGRGFWNR